MKLQIGKLLFPSKNCDAAVVFGQKMAARPQGQKKNHIQLRSDRKAERMPKNKINYV